MSTAPPYAEKLRHVTPDAARAARILCDARHLEALRQFGAIDAVEITPTVTANTAFNEAGRIVLAHLEGTLDIELDLARYPALQIVAASAGDRARHALRSTLANALLAPLVQRFQAADLGRWRVASVERAPAGVASGERFDVALLHDGVMHRLSLSASGATLDVLHKRLAALPSRLATQAYASASTLKVAGSIALGARNVPLAALQSLRPGDVVLRAFGPSVAQALNSSAAFTARAMWGATATGMRRIHARVVIDGTQVTVEEKPFMNEEPLQAEWPDTLPGNDETLHETPAAASGEASETGSHSTLQHDDEDAPLDIGLLDLPVQFEIDSVALPLAQLAALRPGYVIELAAPVLDTPVRLVSHGQTVGYGEIVCVGEHLGVRITRMAYAGDSDR
ncbi:Type III secretion inner membrane protein (plasmid) [Paraburkholderia caribensis MBA4]|uniref:Type III secretion inner membrane protein n=1 Tax=Paraburkholderia caribensis MBA4 TaxID=1323664 RepID=A0A0N7JVX8_9BURK|nr:type III secretion system cytoplasmic ring protein SctQ [Paraburkholderia caribensis]ALL70453.1 Type III secretion inner membrane protein [Paraburkholderia caribensis MBA4]